MQNWTNLILCTVTYTGVVERLQIVIAHTNDQDSSITEVNEENRTLRKEIELMKSYIIRLERRLDSQRDSGTAERKTGQT